MKGTKEVNIQKVSAALNTHPPIYLDKARQLTPLLSRKDKAKACVDKKVTLSGSRYSTYVSCFLDVPVVESKKPIGK
jgi:hypothetical protein